MSNLVDFKTKRKSSSNKGEKISQTLEVKNEITGLTEERTVSYRKRKSIPKKCSTPRQLCLKCFSHIKKNDRYYYDKKICIACFHRNNL